MAQVQFTEIFDSGGESKTNKDLHLNQAVYDYNTRALILPMRFRLVEGDPVFTKTAGHLAVFQDAICLTSNHRKMVEKILKNLHCRLTRKCPKTTRWYFPWRKRQDLDIGFRLFVTYQLGFSPKTFNTNEINEANWPDLVTLFNRLQPGEAMFSVDWWFKGERMEESVEVWKDAKSR